MGCDVCAAQDVDGSAIILAERHIAIGDEVRYTHLRTDRLRAWCVTLYLLASCGKAKWACEFILEMRELIGAFVSIQLALYLFKSRGFRCLVILVNRLCNTHVYLFYFILF